MKNRIAIFASGTGTNAERIMQVFSNHPQIEVVLLIASKAGIGALDKARAAGVPAYVCPPKTDFSPDGPIAQLLKEYGITHIVLGGFLAHVPDWMLAAYPDKIVNIHPSLLPKHGGKGMYGHHVHQAVLDAGEKESGITIHLVNEFYDSGAPLFQAKCPVLEGDTADTLAARVHQLEYQYFPAVIENWVLGK